MMLKVKEFCQGDCQKSLRVIKLKSIYSCEQDWWPVPGS